MKNTNLKRGLVIFLVLFLFFNLVKSWIKLKDRLKFIKETRISLVEEQKKQEDLKRELARTQRPEFIERAAREKLNMGKEGEVVVLLPTPVLSPSPTPTPVDTSSNWQKWLRLFW